MDLTSHPLFVPAAGVLAALALFAIVLYASSRKPQKRKNLQVLEAERFTDGVEGVKFVEENGTVVRRSTRSAPQPVAHPQRQGRRLRRPGRALSGPRRRPAQAQEGPRAGGRLPDPRQGEPGPASTLPTATSKAAPQRCSGRLAPARPARAAARRRETAAAPAGRRRERAQRGQSRRRTAARGAAAGGPARPCTAPRGCRAIAAPAAAPRPAQRPPASSGRPAPGHAAPWRASHAAPRPRPRRPPRPR
jgi:hypothetical protein